MSQDKRTKKTDAPLAPAAAIAHVVAAPGMCLPIHYKGSIIYISDSTPVEIDVSALEHEPAIHFRKALEAKHIVEVGDKK